MEKYRNQYEVKKSIRFELKPVQESESINFETTQKYVKEKYFSGDLQREEDRNLQINENLKKVFHFIDKYLTTFDDFVKDIETRKIPYNCLFVNAQLLEHLDSPQYHRNKKNINKTKFVFLNHLAGDNHQEWFFNGFEVQFKEIYKYLALVKNYSFFTGGTPNKNEKLTSWYLDISSLLNYITNFEESLSFIRINNLDNLYLKEDQKNIYNKSISILNNLLEETQKDVRNKIYTSIRELIKESTFIECGLLTLNSKSINKNPQKLEKLKQWLETTRNELESSLQEIHSLDEERTKVLDGDKLRKTKGLYSLLNESSKQWVYLKKDKQPDFALHLLSEPKFNQGIFEKIQLLKQLRNDNLQNKNKKQISEIQEEINTLNIRKRLIQDRKRIFLEKGVLSFKTKKSVDIIVEELEQIKNPGKKNQLLNFQYIWETNTKNCIKIEDLNPNEDLLDLYQKNIALVNSKKKLSQKYGNQKSIVNSLQREIERQSKIDYQAVLIRDKDLYYLALLDRHNRKNLWDKYFQKVDNSHFQVLEYERLTFKALEKLALIENATFKEFDDISDNILASKLRDIYEKQYKSKQFQEYKLTREEKASLPYDKIKIKEFAKQKEIELKENIIQILINVISKLGYSFKPKGSYSNLEEFEKDINLQCYKQNWIDIDWSKLLEAEKKGEIKLFKIHNKDFSRSKRQYNDRKNNLFTQYWLDLFENNNPHIRILPEIDLYKKRKEYSVEEVKNIVTKRKGRIIKLESNRFVEDKIYATFRLVFYPEQKMDNVSSFNQLVLDSNLNYYLGLDRGENELVTYCLIDSNGKVVVDIDGNPVIGNWNLDDNNYDYAAELKQFTSKRTELLNKISSMNEASNEEQKKQFVRDVEALSILESESIKKGFKGHLLEGIIEILKLYPDTYIVLEDLDSEGLKGSSNKEDTLDRSLGASAYQVIEDAIVSKLKYFQDKDNDFNGLQFVPNIERIRDLREVKNLNELERNKFGRIRFVSSKSQIGRVLFVDEFLTSQMCPDCKFCIVSDKVSFERAKKFGKPILCLKENQRSINENGVISIDNKTLEISYWEMLNSKDKKKDPSILLKPRLKAQKLKTKYQKDLGSDPFYCPDCNKNTVKETFIEPLYSGDDVAAYNIAKRGLELIHRKIK